MDMRQVCLGPFRSRSYYSGVGTVDAKIQMKKSTCLSLLTKDNFRKWATSNANGLGLVSTAEVCSETDTIVPSSKVNDTATGEDEEVEKLIGLTTLDNANSSCLAGYICRPNALWSTTPELFGSCWTEPIVGFWLFFCGKKVE